MEKQEQPPRATRKIEFDKTGLISLEEYEKLSKKDKEGYHTFLGPDGEMYAFDREKRPDLLEEEKEWEDEFPESKESGPDKNRS